MRATSTKDDDLSLDIRQKERAAFEIFDEKIDEHDLPMKPVGVEWDTVGNTITFYFTANKRVDFRALVRDLAHIYHRRIELRQISPRVDAQMMGGCGACGRELCCSSFIEKPKTVPSQIAQSQTTSQNLSKLVGVCGQLKCCLRYEVSTEGVS
jgi:cell fate regulator YaaT (PSP1 superfamily)